MGLRIIVLGSAAGGGFPQWNCRCPVCEQAWAGNPAARPRTQSSVAVTQDGHRWLLLNASPDIKQQIMATPALQPRRPGRDSPITDVLVTNGDVDHVAGLLSLREKQRFALLGAASTLAALAANPIFDVLDPAFVSRRAIELDSPHETAAGVRVTLFAVPGKTPLYLERAEVRIGEETGDVVGVEVAAGASRFFYIPGCAAVTPRLKERVAGAPLLFFDGTTYTDDEMPRLGLSGKTAHRMGHLAMSGEAGSVAAWAGTTLGRRVFIHINNSNPALIDDGPERAALAAAGWDVAHDGMELELTP
jgi:pyrroloquinoline quinone biosynthesis protein B